MKTNQEQTSIDTRNEIHNSYLSEISRLIAEGNTKGAQKIKKNHQKWISAGRPVLVVERTKKIKKIMPNGVVEV